MAEKGRKCVDCKTSFDVVVPENLFEKVSPQFGGISYPFAEPTRCWPCRRRNRLTFKNERQLYRRTCSLTGMSVVSTFSPDKPYPVIRSLEVGADGIDATQFGMEVGEDVLARYSDLKRLVPRGSVLLRGSENCAYNNDVADSKNAYLSFGSTKLQDSAYISSGFDIRDSYDIFKSLDVELSHKSFWLTNCYGVRESAACETSRDLIFCVDCIGCTDCIGCYRLRHESFCIFNTPYSKEEYLRRKAALQLHTWSGQENTRRLAATFIATVPHPPTLQVNNEECVGDMLRMSKGVHMGFSMSSATSSSFLFESSRSSWASDCDSVYTSELVLSCVACDTLYHCAFLENCYGCSDVYYSARCVNSKNLLLCVGLYRKEYCILNKQYSREEYERIAPGVIGKLVGHGLWGEMFESTFSDYGYNESEAAYYFPAEREEVLRRGGKWSEYEAETPSVKKTVSASSLADSIWEINDDILEFAIVCERTSKPFRILKGELEFYRSQGIPFPRHHPEERYRELLAMRNPPVFYDRTCAECECDIRTTFSPERPEVVVCERCLQKLEGNDWLG